MNDKGRLPGWTASTHVEGSLLELSTQGPGKEHYPYISPRVGNVVVLRLGAY